MTVEHGLLTDSSSSNSSGSCSGSCSGGGGGGGGGSCSGGGDGGGGGGGGGGGMSLVYVGAAMTVLSALADGGYSDDVELAFIRSFLQDERLQALLAVSYLHTRRLNLFHFHLRTEHV